MKYTNNKFGACYAPQKISFFLVMIALIPYQTYGMKRPGPPITHVFAPRKNTQITKDQLLSDIKTGITNNNLYTIEKLFNTK